jgi:chlorobactene glucosyltransferase
VDDLTLTRRIQAGGFRWRAAHIADLVTCRMYHSSGEALNGFIKNLFAAFDFRLLLFLFAFFWLAVMFWEPLIILLLSIFGQAQHAQAGTLIGCVGLAVSLWLIPYIALGIPFGLAFLYPLTILANVAAACQSLRRSLSGTLSWKGRTMTRPRWRWL